MNRYVLLIVAMPFFLIAVSYALYSQNLSLVGNTQKPAYSSSEDLKVTYQKTVTNVSGGYQYSISPMTVTNDGASSVTAWQVIFNLPTDFTNLVCNTSINCSVSGTVLTITSGSTNGLITAGGNQVSDFSFNSNLSTYTLQDVNVSGTVNVGYQVIGGFTTLFQVTNTKTRGKWLDITYHVTVTNSSGSSISSWRITTPWNSTNNAVRSLDAPYTYVVGTNILTINGASSVVNGQNLQFNTVLSTKLTGWSPTPTLEGQL